MARKKEIRAEKYIGILILAIAIVALAHLYLLGLALPVPQKYSSESSTFLNLPFASIAPAHYLQYNHSAAPTCQTSQALKGSSGLFMLCTSAFSSTNTSNASIPYSITLTYYIFNSKPNQSAYIANVTQFLNTTPWPSNIAATSNLSSYDGVSVIDTSIAFESPTPYNYVSTVYVEKGETMLSVSSLSINGSDIKIAQALDSQMIYNWYLNATA